MIAAAITTTNTLNHVAKSSIASLVSLTACDAVADVTVPPNLSRTTSPTPNIIPANTKVSMAGYKSPKDIMSHPFCGFSSWKPLWDVLCFLWYKNVKLLIVTERNTMLLGSKVFSKQTTS